MITLDIEDTSIKIMSISGRRVQNAASLPLEPGLVRDGVIVDPSTVGRRVGELMTAQGITDKKAVVSISGIHAIYRVQNVPKLPAKLLDEAAKREMERLMPVPLNELYTSYQAISLSEMETALCLVGMPRNTVDAMLETLRQAGLQLEFMDVRPLALARVADEQNALIINIQPTGFDIVLTIDGVPELVRSLPFPADATSTDDKVAEVKEELERTVTYYNSSHKGGEITARTAAFVSGELGDILSGTLDYRAKPLPQIFAYSDGLNASEYAANIGLALRDARMESTPSRVSINVAPEAYQPKAFPLIQLVSWAFIIIAALVVVGFGFITLQSYRETQSLQAQVNAALGQVAVRSGTDAAIKQLQIQIDAVNSSGAKFTQQLDATKDQRAGANEDISAVISLLPGIVDLKGFAYGSGITITGTAPDDTTIVNYVRNLRNSGTFAQVLISEMRELEFNEWQFTLAIK
jgi:type IV pilus assembly protein PilM